MTRRAHALARTAAGATLLALTGCVGPTGESPSSTGTSSPSSTSPSAPSSSEPSESSSTSSDTSSDTAAQASACVTDVREAMTPTQRAGQLLMAAMDPGPVTSLDPYVADQGLGSMLYLGGWEGAATVRAASEHLQQVAPTIDGTKVGMLVSADQEGGEVQQLTGAGFSDMPSGVEQAQLPDLRSAARAWGAELASAGVNVNLAPVADTVPESIGRAKRPDRPVRPPVRLHARGSRCGRPRVRARDAGRRRAAHRQALPGYRADHRQHRPDDRGHQRHRDDEGRPAPGRLRHRHRGRDEDRDGRLGALPEDRW